ncbi:MAG TPA: beta-phosphoglucomutase [Phycisphaerales bacterium]|nr:beta-phosphoglucomutase [Phycisphaerales bacterium]
MPIEAVIFDLDGVIVSTDDLHYRGWKQLADEERIDFDRRTNERMRGVSRMESLEILLERAGRSYTPAEKEEMASRKNGYYRRLLETLTAGDLLPGAAKTLAALKARKIKVAVASSSRNAGTILRRIGLENAFDAVVDGNDISRSKPDPEVFVKAAERLGLDPCRCLVVEDAVAGVEAALAAKMPVLAVGYAASDARATCRASGLDDVDLPALCQTLPN